MREGRASTTAEGVAFFRGLASLPRSPLEEVDDPLAPILLGGPLRVALDAARRLAPLRRLARALSIGLFDHVALRTLTIDDAARAAVREGATQLVVLGAGLDARAFRMAELADVIVYEVDFPATQRAKRARLGDRRALAREVRFVPIDFERDSLDERLDAVGHESARPTLWIWEGVTPYLVRDAITSTLDVVARRSARGSTLVVSYITPELARIEAFEGARRVAVPRALQPIMHGVFALLGEEVRAPIERDAMAALLQERGFGVRHDGDSREWARAHPPRGGASRVVIAERVAVAVKG